MSRPEVRACPRVPFFSNPPGQCRWCDLPVIDGKTGEPSRRRLWHPECLTEYNITRCGEVTRRAVEERDGGICAYCDVDTTEPSRLVPYHKGRGWIWESSFRRHLEYSHIGWRADWFADHVYPLWLVDRAAPEAWRLWTLENLQTLCRPCHTEKTSREAAARAKIARLIRKRNGRRGRGREPLPF